MEDQLGLADILRNLFVEYDSHYVVISHEYPAQPKFYTIGCKCIESDYTKIYFEYIALIDGDRVRDVRRFVLASDPEFFTKVFSFLANRHYETSLRYKDGIYYS